MTFIHIIIWKYINEKEKNMNVLKHLKTVSIHKFWVGYYCFKCGLIKQGLLHDMSKFTPTEFLESVKYYSGVRSPIDACKEQNGYSMAWFHHRGRNKHHWEYWIDNYERGGTVTKMPYKYALEMVCDFLGAGTAYSGGIKNFSMDDEYAWWESKKQVAKIHPATVELVSSIFDACLAHGPKKALADKSLLITLKQNYEHDKRPISIPIKNW